MGALALDAGGGDIRAAQICKMSTSSSNYRVKRDGEKATDARRESTA